MTYEQQLMDRRWWLTRKVILLRDNEQCTRCGSVRDLQVHHTYYIPGNMAWEYPFEALVTLCRYCHEITHGKLTNASRARGLQSIGCVLRDMVDNEINRINNHG